MPMHNREGLVTKGEESTEMGGYFICNGIERIIRMITLQRRHYIMALRRGAYRKRGANYTENATLLRYGTWHCHVTPQRRLKSLMAAGGLSADLAIGKLARSRVLAPKPVYLLQS